MGSLLHDVGKLLLPTELLGKPGAFTEAELDEMRTHPAAGARLIAGAPEAREAIGCVLYHHERWDGLGYPARLDGPLIPIEARLIGLADAFDAMTSTRPYRAALTPDAALEELVRLRRDAVRPCAHGGLRRHLVDARPARGLAVGESLRQRPRSGRL